MNSSQITFTLNELIDVERQTIYFVTGIYSLHIVPGYWAANKIPAATSLVVLGENLSARRVTEQKGRASATQTAVESPTTPAPTTTTFTLFILEQAASEIQSTVLNAA